MTEYSTIEPDMLQAALTYARRGRPVFPCDPSNKRPFPGTRGFKDATTDEATICAWWAKYPDAMIGMPTGAASRIWVLDIDAPDLFEANCPIELPETRRADTGKGYHLYFEFDPERPVYNTQRNKNAPWPMPRLPGAETRGEGGYVIVPPSLHPEGRRYEWTHMAPPASATDELLELVWERPAKALPSSAPRVDQPSGEDSNYGLAALDGECAAIRSAGNGEQEGTLNEAALKIGGFVAGGELSMVTAKGRLLSAGLAMPSYNPRDPWTTETIIAKVERGLADGAANPRRAPECELKSKVKPDRQTTAEPQWHEPEEAVEDEASGVNLSDFRAYMPAHRYIFMPSGEQWPASSVNARVPPVTLRDRNGDPILDDKNKPKTITAAMWLDQHKPVEQLTWAPGESQVVEGRLISDGGWIKRAGCAVFNLYRPPNAKAGDAKKAEPWVTHIMRIYPEDAEHIINWLAHRVQRPDEKINHAIVLGGAQGIGKDTILEPVKAAIGPWNFTEVSPAHMLGRFNGFVKSVILRVSEARDLGDTDRFAFYDHMKTYTAAPPDVLRVDEKNIKEYSVFNVCGVIITTNHKTDGIYLPADDRRHYVAWSELSRDSFPVPYWSDLYRWYASGGTEHVVAYLQQRDLSNFDPKAPPPKTAAFWDIVASNQAPEDAELADALDNLNRPSVVTVARIAEVASDPFAEWLKDRRNSRKIPHRFEECGYVAVRNPSANDGMFKVGGKRCAVYAKRDLSTRDAIHAASSLLGR